MIPFTGRRSDTPVAVAPVAACPPAAHGPDGPPLFAPEEGPATGLRVLTVLIADDAPSTRRGLVELLEDTSDMVCVAAVGDASSAISEAARYQPDLAVLDVFMPGGGGLGAAVGIREVSPRTRRPRFCGPDVA
jgi:PleD family two-component response regulator